MPEEASKAVVAEAVVAEAVEAEAGAVDEAVEAVEADVADAADEQAHMLRNPTPYLHNQLHLPFHVNSSLNKNWRNSTS